MQPVSLPQLRDDIVQICQRCGRRPEEIRIIGASKHQSIEKIHQLAQAGLRDFGENYVQELLPKKQLLEAEDPELSKKIQWHFIGRLQQRKVRSLIGVVAAIHSLDRIPLALTLDKAAAQHGQEAHALVQVNIGREDSKGGILPDALDSLIRACRDLDQVVIDGLMTLPPYAEDPEQVRPYFRQLRELRDAINARAVYKQPLRELSMGMSHDYAVAIEEGATMIRLGTILFGERR